MKKLEKKNVKLYIAIAVTTAVLIYAVALIIYHADLYKRASNEYGSLQEQYVTENLGQSDDSSLAASQVGDDAQTWENLDAAYPDLSIDHEGLLSVNSDYIAWIYVPSLDISYPVVKEKEPNQYIDTTFEGQKNYSACLFMDVNSQNFTGRSDYIYGHNMRNGSMFGKLKKLLDASTREAFEADPYIYIYTPDAVYQYRAFAYYKTTGDSQAYITAPDDAAYDQLTSFIASNNLYSAGKEIDLSTRPDLLTLSTCSGGAGTDKRLVLHAYKQEVYYADGTDNAKEQNGTSSDAGIKSQMTELNADLVENTPDDKYRTAYEVFVYSFYDSDDDGIGDLNGLTQKLDYINDGDPTTHDDLGFNEIWLMPICPSTTYHKYDVTDYQNIDPEYGTLEDFDQLVEQCHKRGVRLIVDTVMNHTSSQHPWFVAAADYLRNLPTGAEPNEQDCPEYGYYHFSREQLDGYAKLTGTDWYYEARFWSEMPDLNLDNEAVQQEFKEVADFWMDRGVDGFRMDAVTSYYTGEDSKSIDALKWFNDYVKARDPEQYIVGECWANSSVYAKYYQSGIDSLFDFDFSGSEGVIAACVKGSKKASYYVDSVSAEPALFGQYSDHFINAPFYVNHDMARSAGFYTGKYAQAKVKIAGALNLFMPGNCFVYYGEELGMKGSKKDEDKRAPMQWAEDPKADGMCLGPKDMDKIEMKYGSLESQSQDPYSIYQYYKNAVAIRNAYPIIARGDMVRDDLTNDDIAAFSYTSGSSGLDLSGYEDILVIANLSEENQTLEIPEKYVTLSSVLVTSEERVSFEDQMLSVPAYGIAVLTSNN